MLSDSISKRKSRTYAKIPEELSKLKKENQKNDVVQCTSETNSSTFPVTKQAKSMYAML